MKRLLALAAMVAAAPCLGQDVRQQAATITFPTFTTEQNWGRATTLQFATLVGGQAFAKARGSSAEEFGRLSGELFAPNWGRPDEGSATRWARLAQNSIRASRGGAVEVLNVNDTLVVMRATRPYVLRKSLFKKRNQPYSGFLFLFYTDVAYYNSPTSYLSA